MHANWVTGHVKARFLISQGSAEPRNGAVSERRVALDIETTTICPKRAVSVVNDVEQDMSKVMARSEISAIGNAKVLWRPSCLIPLLLEIGRDQERTMELGIAETPLPGAKVGRRTDRGPQDGIFRRSLR